MQACTREGGMMFTPRESGNEVQEEHNSLAWRWTRVCVCVYVSKCVREKEKVLRVRRPRDSARFQ